MKEASDTAYIPDGSIFINARRKYKVIYDDRKQPNGCLATAGGEIQKKGIIPESK
jgi:hypothetical protein